MEEYKVRKPKLVVMAAGLGSRYGGLKQMESVTKAGEIILDFAVFDAMKAGFEEVVFIIKPEMEEIFKQRVLDPISKYMKTSYVFQEITQLPDGYSVPEGRVKPWGTCHAVMACGELLDGPFAVINADDYYGRDAFKKVYDFLTADEDEHTYCMAGYYVENTLSEQGTVTRGVCKTDENHQLVDIQETKEIGWDGERIVYPAGDELVEIQKGTPVSMNFWGFKKSMMDIMVEGFPAFLDDAIANNPMKGEYLLPIKVGELLEAGAIKVNVLEATDKWYGVTYKEDKELVEKAFADMKAAGKYPEKLWP
jgi:NDP-sugar pyrophosphorylase family protein